MKRFIAALILMLALTAYAGAQEETKPASSEATQEKEPSLPLLWANFAILALGLGYLVSKNVPPLLRARSEEIQTGMRDSARLKTEAEVRLADVERRLAAINTEIGKVRLQLITEMNVEGNRLRADTERMVTRIHEQAQQEIQFMTKTGVLELKAYSAQLAIDLASQRIQARMNHETQQRMVDLFIRDLHKDGSRGLTRQ